MLIVHMYSFVCEPEGILLPFGCLDLLGFVFFSSSNLAHLRERSSCRAPQACVLAGIASQNIKGQCCCTQLLSVCQFQDDFRGLLLSLQPPMQFPYLSVKNMRKSCSYIHWCTGGCCSVVLFDPLHCFPRRDALHVFIPTLCIANHNCSPLGC